MTSPGPHGQPQSIGRHELAVVERRLHRAAHIVRGFGDEAMGHEFVKLAAFVGRCLRTGPRGPVEEATLVELVATLLGGYDAIPVGCGNDPA